MTNNEQASLEEVNTLFAPGTGKLWTYYNESLKQWLVLQGTRYVLAPNAAGHVGPMFAQFFNRLAVISSDALSVRSDGRGLQLYSSLRAQQGD